ncbi:MAG: hypothetical protein KIT09_25055 [Bryobacteraceae bacterium]|nr:hypothetical protein [Bryobacteraceae bacterium]
MAFLVIAIAVCAEAQPSGDHSGRLPAPTGAFHVGRVTLLCEDPSRLEPLDPNSAPRRIMVDVWYPAERSVSTEPQSAEYLNVAAFERGLGEDALRKQLRGSYDAIISRRVTTHAMVQAPFASSLRLAPVLLFSPGGGMIRELYTSQMADLASHGYIVAAMTHTYDGFFAVFPDGTSITHDGGRWPKIPSVEGEANLNQLEWHTSDMLAVLDYISRSASHPLHHLRSRGTLTLRESGRSVIRSEVWRRHMPVKEIRESRPVSIRTAQWV